MYISYSCQLLSQEQQQARECCHLQTKREMDAGAEIMC